MRWIVAAIIAVYFSTSFAAPKPAPEKASSEAAWPREYTLSNQQKVSVFQPQVNSLKQNQIEATAAFKLSKDKKDLFGSFELSGKALVNKEDGVVTLSNLKVSKVQIPTNKATEARLQEELQKHFSGQEYTVSYQSIIKNLDVQVAESERSAPVIKNDPPLFIFTKRPGVLVMISGDPVWQPTAGSKEVKRVVNTSAMILEEEGKPYYIFGLGRWFSSKQLMGPYNVAKEPSSKYVMIKDGLIKDKKVDPMNNVGPGGRPLYPEGINPEIYISTRPAELLQSEGEPKFSAVQDTSLLYMSNSPNSIFMDSKTQDYYVLVTGRWFMAKSLNGPWSFVNGKSLPQDFAKIPVTSPVAEVLVSVPGTAQAKEAKLVSNIPQMAKVPKDMKPKSIQCEGAVKWVAIQGTSIKYGENCNTPLLQVTDKQFYAVQDGVWFFASSEKGPWQVATAVPDDIYKIPTSSPLYYVTYVHVYDAAGEYVTVGYTPGYRGTFVSPDGTIVYGTGYVYPSVVYGSQWYPPPSTYGWGVGYGWGYDDGFYMGFAYGTMMSPWGWGTCCWGGTYVGISVTNVYHNWGTHTVITGSGGGGVNVNTIGNTKFVRAHGSNEIYAGHDGQVYRRNPDGSWERNVGPGTWNPVDRNSSRNLENMHEARTAGVSREAQVQAQPRAQEMQRTGMENRPTRQPGPPPANLRGGGGMRAGGGFGGGGFRR